MDLCDLFTEAAIYLKMLCPSLLSHRLKSVCVDTLRSCYVIRKMSLSQRCLLVGHVCDPSYVGGIGKEDHSLKNLSY
jgi:hypothetical protein